MDVKKFKDKYMENITAIPLEDLGRIVYNKHLKYLDDLRDSDENPEKLYAPIKEILESVEFSKVAFLIQKLYYSTLISYFKNDEKWQKQDKKLRLNMISMIILDVEFFKLNFNAIEDFKRTGNTRKLDIVQCNLDKIIESRSKIIKSYDGQLRLLRDVLGGEREEIELYRSNDEMDYLKGSCEELYSIFIKEVYSDEPVFKSESEDDIFTRALLSNVLSGLFIKKEDGSYFLAESGDD